MRKGIFAISILCAAFAVIVIAISMGFPASRGGVPGPGTFPILISILLLVSSITLFISGRTIDKDVTAGLLTDGTKRVYIAMAVMIAYCVVLNKIGFVVTSSFLLFGLIQWFRGKNIVVNAVMSIGIVVFIYSVFTFVLKVPMRFGMFI